MNDCLDTGLCVQESFNTLGHQQKQLIAGHRDVQMFPTGTVELLRPSGFNRYQNARGVYHYNPKKINSYKIEELSSKGRENEFLNLGPYNKLDIALKLLAGEKMVFVTEYTPDGSEVRSAVGSDSTVEKQHKYFEGTKMDGNVIVIGPPPPRVTNCLEKANNHG